MPETFVSICVVLLIAGPLQLVAASEEPIKITKQRAAYVEIEDTILFFPPISKKHEFFYVDNVWVDAWGGTIPRHLYKELVEAFAFQEEAKTKKQRADKVKALRAKIAYDEIQYE